MSNDDTPFSALRLRNSLCPSSDGAWSKEGYTYWTALHAARDELRNTVNLAGKSFRATEQDKDLTVDAKRRKKAELADHTLEQLVNSKALQKARSEVTAILGKWDAKRREVLVVPKPEDSASAVLLWEVRSQFRELENERDRLAWIGKHGNDPLIASALLHGPAGLTNLTEAERALLWHKIDMHLDPEIAKAREQVADAMAELEQGFKAGRAMVTKAAEAAWVEPPPNIRWPRKPKPAKATTTGKETNKPKPAPAWAPDAT